jgi:hypothetical protein
MTPSPPGLAALIAALEMLKDNGGALAPAFIESIADRAIVALRAHAELEVDARRYRTFWLDPIPQMLDDIGLQIIRYGDCEGAFNKEWCDRQLDAAISSRGSK